MAHYLNVGIANLQNPRVDLAMAARGQQTFQTYCIGCHSSPTYGSGVNADGSPQLFNIGTANFDHGVASGKFATKLVGLADPASAKIAVALVGDRELGPDDPLQKILSTAVSLRAGFSSGDVPSGITIAVVAGVLSGGYVENGIQTSRPMEHLR